MTRSTSGISVCIVCRDEADKLPACLESVGWADEVVVLDLESDDGSADVARAAGARVLVHAPVPVVEAVRNVVAEAAAHPWVLALDPDERVSPGLAAELRGLSARDDLDAVVLRSMNFDFGYPASHPVHRYDPKPRFYRRDRVSWPTFPNAHPVIAEERLVRLPAVDDLVLVHDRNRSVAEAVERVLRYAPAQAQAMIDAGEVFTARRMLSTLARKLHRHVVDARALRDGTPGLVRSGVLVAFHFYVWAAFWHQSGAGRTPADDELLRRLDSVLHAADRVASGSYRPARLRRRARSAAGSSRGGAA